MAIPPMLHEWKATPLYKTQLQHQVTPSFYYSSYVVMQPLSSLNDNIEGDDITAITFKANWDEELEVSVIIE